jgi:hypothetical protein
MAATIGAVVYAALDARLVDEVVVVRQRLDRRHRRGRGGPRRRGWCSEPVPARARRMRARRRRGPGCATVVVFLDADLVGLRPTTSTSSWAAVRSARPTWPAAVRPRPGRPTDLPRPPPVLHRQRALRRELFDRLAAGRRTGWRVEAALNSLVAHDDLVRRDQVLAACGTAPRRRSWRPLWPASTAKLGHARHGDLGRRPVRPGPLSRDSLRSWSAEVSTTWQTRTG